VTRHRLVAGPFSALEPRLFAAIEQLQRQDPLARVEVLVGSNLLGLDLRRRFAQWLPAHGARRGHANVRFPTFLDLARELAGPVPGRPAPPALLFATVAAAVPRVAEASQFGDARHRVGFVRTVEATLRDFVDAGIAPEIVSTWAAGWPEPDRRAALAALAALYREAARGLEGFAHDGAVFREAARRSAQTDGDPLLVYGFYDFTGLQRDLLAALAKGRALQVFLPRYAGDLGGFSKATQDVLAAVLGCEPEPAESQGDATSRSIFLARFAERAAGAELPEDGTVTLVSAADDASEAREAAREILLGREAGLPLAGTAVLLRQESEAARFAAALDRAGIPCFRRPADTWADTPAGRALALWLRLEEEGFRRDDVLDVLELADAARPDPHAPHFRGLVRHSGVVRGLAEWSAAVARLAAASPDGATDDEGLSRLATRLPGGPEAARRLAERWEALRDSASGWPAGPVGWADWAAEVGSRLERLFAPGPLPDPAAAALDALASLSEGGGKVTREVAFEVFLSGLASRAAKPGRLGHDGVALLTVMEARGLAFDHVLVPGLVEKSFPSRARPDPLLFDDERESLAAASGRPLAPRTLRRPAEERLLFAIAADASRRRLTLLASRRDSALDRERTPSQFFTRATDALGRMRSTRLGAPETFGPAVSLSEARRRALEAYGTEAVSEVFPALAAALVRRQLRARPFFGPFEGRLASPDLAPALAAHVPGPTSPLSASALESFCRCAYQFFLRRVARLTPIEETDEPSDLSPLELGQLFHDAARRAAAVLRGRPFSELADDRKLARLAASSAAAALDAFEEDNGAVLSPPLLRDLALERLRDHVKEWLLFERRGSRGAFAPAGAEVRFGTAAGRGDAADDDALSSDEPALSGSGVPLRGRIDLVSTDSSGDLTRVTDFKVRASDKSLDALLKKRAEGAVLWSGEMLQLPVYALAAAGPVGRRGNLPVRIASEYLFLAASRDPEGPPVRVEPVALDPEETRAAVAQLEIILDTVRGSVAAGAFRPRPAGKLRKDQCRLCAFSAVCGPGHARLYALKAENPDAAVRRLDALGDIP
jgi:ATP-dependent helicase/DNAse subunit B